AGRRHPVRAPLAGPLGRGARRLRPPAHRRRRAAPDPDHPERAGRALVGGRVRAGAPQRAGPAGPGGRDDPLGGRAHRAAPGRGRADREPAALSRGPRSAGQPVTEPRRVRVVHPRTDAAARGPLVPAARADDAATEVDEIYLRSLIRGQARLALLIGTATAALLGGVAV